MEGKNSIVFAILLFKGGQSNNTQQYFTFCLNFDNIYSSPYNGVRKSNAPHCCFYFFEWLVRHSHQLKCLLLYSCKVIILKASLFKISWLERTYNHIEVMGFLKIFIIQLDNTKIHSLSKQFGTRQLMSALASLERLVEKDLFFKKRHCLQSEWNLGGKNCQHPHCCNGICRYILLGHLMPKR